MRATVLGREATTVIVYNPELEKGQLQGIQINIEKTKSELLEIQGKLLKRSKGELKKGKKPTFESASKAVSKILGHREYMDDIFECEILEKDNHIFLTFSDSEDKLNVIGRNSLGKLPCSLTEAICLTMRLYLPTEAHGALKVHSSR